MQYRLSVVAVAFVTAATAVAAAQQTGRTDGAAIPAALPETLADPDLSALFESCSSGPIAGVLGSGSSQWPSFSGNQTGRLNRNGIGTTCAVPKICSIFDITPGRAFDAYTFSNETGGAQCVEVTLEVVTQADCNLQANAYLGTYDPANICTNYLADPGVSSGSPPLTTMLSFNVANGSDAVIVVHTIDPGTIGCQYNLTVSPCTTQQLYALDAFGGVHLVGDNAVGFTPAPPYFGFNVARDMEMTSSGAYVLDGFGGIHAAGSAPPLTPLPPYFGFDIAQDLELGTMGGAYALDGFGGVHAFGGAAVIAPATPYFGFDVARDMELGNGGYYVLDGFGGLHRGGAATALSPGPPYFGFDIARDVELGRTTGAYVLDGFGGVHAIGGAGTLVPATPYFGFNVAADFELGITGFYVLDRFGGLHTGGGAPVVSPAPPYFGFDAARDLEIR